jgi:hypothetical protein
VNVDEEIIEYRNAWYDDDDDDWRNGGETRNQFPLRARRPVRRRVIVHGGAGGAVRPSVRPAAPWSPAPAPYYPPSAAGRLFNMPAPVLVDAAAQLFAALSSLPSPPQIIAGDTDKNLTNLIEYQRSLAAYAKRNEQIRTAGALAKLLMA